jgi:ribosomal protein S12 methylthiotransferase
MDFVRETRFERLGAFAYSPEQGTPAAEYDGRVPEELKRERLDALMTAQREITAEQNRELVGTELDAVVDGRGPDGGWAGRTVRDAPDVDGSISFEDAELAAGQFVRVLVTDAVGYDLVGRASC